MTATFAWLAGIGRTRWISDRVSSAQVQSITNYSIFSVGWARRKLVSSYNSWKSGIGSRSPEDLYLQNSLDKSYVDKWKVQGESYCSGYQSNRMATINEWQFS